MSPNYTIALTTSRACQPRCPKQRHQKAMKLIHGTANCPCGWPTKGQQPKHSENRSFFYCPVISIVLGHVYGVYCLLSLLMTDSQEEMVLDFVHVEELWKGMMAVFSSVTAALLYFYCVNIYNKVQLLIYQILYSKYTFIMGNLNYNSKPDSTKTL